MRREWLGGKDERQNIVKNQLVDSRKSGYACGQGMVALD
jgi:hypothetical protein